MRFYREKREKARKKCTLQTTLEERAKLPNLKPQELLSFTKERLGEVKRQVPVPLNSYRAGILEIENQNPRESMSVTIQPFRMEFQEGAQTLIEAYLSERWGYLDTSLNPDIRDIAEAYREGYFAVALHEGGVIGTGAILQETTEAARVVRMTVANERRGEGIGRKILDALCEEARRRGYRSLVLETTETWDSAIAFYIRYGFRVLGRWGGDCHFELDLLPKE